MWRGNRQLLSRRGHAGKQGTKEARIPSPSSTAFITSKATVKGYYNFNDNYKTPVVAMNPLIAFLTPCKSDLYANTGICRTQVAD